MAGQSREALQDADQTVLPSRAWITDLADVANVLSASTLEGRQISVRDVRVDAVEDDGFWIVSADQRARIRVLPAEHGLVKAHPGATVSVRGEFRRVTSAMRHIGDAEVSLYAYVVRPAW